MRGFCTFVLHLVLLSCSLNAQSTMTIGTVLAEVNPVLEERIVTEAYRRVGIEISVRYYPAKRSLIESNKGAIDGDLIRLDGTENDYPNLVMIPEAIIVTEDFAFVKDVEFEVEGYKSLSPYVVAIVAGIDTYDEGTRGMRRFIVKTPDQMFRMLDSGRVQVAVHLDYDGERIIKDLKLQGIKMLRPSLLSFNVYHFVHKKHEALVPKLTRALQEMKKEGVIRKMNEEYRKEILAK